MRSSVGTISFAAIFLSLAALFATPVIGLTAVEKAERDEIVFAPSNDPQMNAAMRAARSSLPDFLAIISMPNRSLTSSALKIRMREDEQTEYLWVNPFKQTKDGLIGIVNNTPRLLIGVKDGDQIEFPERDVVDWMYVENGKMFGNYTGCVLLRKRPRSEQAEFKQKFGLDCSR